MGITLELINKLQHMAGIVKESENKDFTALVVVVSSTGKVLLLKRGRTAPYMPEKWSLPGGSSDTNEKPEETAIRELKEETGLVASSLKKIITANFDGYETIIFRSEVSGEPHVSLDLENEGYGWFAIKQIEQLDNSKEIIPGLYKEIKKAL